MPKFHILAYEIHTQVYEVEADNGIQALEKFQADDGVTRKGESEYLDPYEDRGMDLSGGPDPSLEELGITRETVENSKFYTDEDFLSGVRDIYIVDDDREQTAHFLDDKDCHVEDLKESLEGK